MSVEMTEELANMSIAELEAKLERTENVAKCYQHATDRIEEHFSTRAQSYTDKRIVMDILDAMKEGIVQAQGV